MQPLLDDPPPAIPTNGLVGPKEADAWWPATAAGGDKWIVP